MTKEKIQKAFSSERSKYDRVSSPVICSKGEAGRVTNSLPTKTKVEGAAIPDVTVS